MGHIARAYIIAATTFVLTSAEAAAEGEWLHLQKLSWELELEYEGLREQRAGIDDTTHSRYTGKLLLHQAGYVGKPELFDFSVTLTPTLMQGRLDDAVRDEELEGSYLDYDINLGFLRGAEAPVDFSAAASRNTGSLSSNLGNRTDYTLENKSIGMGWQFAPFPMNVAYTERLLDQTFISGQGSTVTRRDEFQKAVRWQARSSKMHMQIEKRWFDDRIAGNDYDMLQERLFHTFRWGKNSHMITQQSYLNREGAFAYKRVTASENVRLQHWDNLFSIIDYDYSSITQNVETTTHSGKYTVFYQPTDEMEVGIGLEGRDSEFGTGAEKEYGSNALLQFDREIPFGGKISFGLNGQLLTTDRASNGTTIDLVDLSFTVPTTLIVLLETRAIDTSTITVMDVTNTVVYSEGVDYLVRALTGGRTELQILTSGQILEGDTIHVSYQAAAQPPAEFTTDALRASLLIDFDWIRFYHNHQIREENLQSGSFSEGQNDLEDRTTGVEVKWQQGKFEATARAESHAYDAGDYSTRSTTFAQTAQYRISPLTQVYANASQIAFESDGRETDLNQWNVNLKWMPLRGMSVQPFVSGWERTEDTGHFEERLTAGLKLKWELRLFDLDLDMSHLDHQTIGTDRTEQRIGLRLIRRSR